MRFSSSLCVLAVSASLAACTAHGATEEESSSANAISSSSDPQRACAAAATYASESPTDLDALPDDKVPASVRQAATELGAGNSPFSHFVAPSVGDVYASSLGTPSVTLFDLDGHQLAIGIPAHEHARGWLNPANGEPLDCSGTPYNVNSNNVNSN